MQTFTQLTQAQQVVSKRDEEILEKIRNNVRQLIQNVAQKYDAKDVKLLDIAPQDHNDVAQFFTQSDVETLDLCQNTNPTYVADLCQNNSKTIPSNRFDFIVCTEVLEHTLKPFEATAEIYRMLKPGGFAFISTPFNLRIHGPLPDCWRFTEHGLRSLLSPFKDVQITPLEEENRFLMPLHYTTIAQK